MSEAIPPRHEIGANVPPLDPAETLGKRLDRDHAALFSEAADLEAEKFALPEAPKTDEEAAKISDFILKAKKVAKKVEDARVAEGRPYLDATKAINTFFGEVTQPLAAMTDARGPLATRVGVYAKVKAERERAERLRQEAKQRAAAERQRQEEQARRDEADRLAREAEEAAARIRAAETDAERAQATDDMLDAEHRASLNRDIAEDHSKFATQHERKADTAGRAAAGDTSKLSKVSEGGSTTSVTKRWAHSVDDTTKLRASLGPLGPYFTPDVIAQALARAVREGASAGSIGSLVIPGVRFFTEDHTNIRAAR